MERWDGKSGHGAESVRHAEMSLAANWGIDRACQDLSVPGSCGETIAYLIRTIAKIYNYTQGCTAPVICYVQGREKANNRRAGWLGPGDGPPGQPTATGDRRRDWIGRLVGSFPRHLVLVRQRNEVALEV